MGGRGRVPGGGVVMKRLPVRLIGLAVVVLVVGGCPAPELFDPLDEVVPLIGLELEVTVMDDGTTRTLEFRGNGFGYYQLNGSTYIRYLDVGDVTIAGSTALRKFVRAGEPEYGYEGKLDAVPGEVELVMAGSAVIRPCTLSLRLPVVALPEWGGTLSRTADLVVPLDFAGGTSGWDHGITAQIRLASGFTGDGSMAVTLDRRHVRSSLEVPASFIQQLPEGSAHLSLSLEWQRFGGEPVSRSSCAPYVELTTRYQGGRRVLLR